MKCVFSARWAEGGLGIVLFLLVSLGSLGLGVACPRACSCPQHSKNVYCSRKNLPAIPAGIPFNTMQLNMNENKFQSPVLSRRNLSNLESLEHLYMSNCGIETITLDTFSDLTKLKWLDLSDNEIRFIADFTFRGLSLDHLFLDNNPKTETAEKDSSLQLSASAFSGLTTMGLYMHKCRLISLSLEVMLPLNGSLRALWLDDNMFETFSSRWLNKFKSLSHLRLGKNPFHCNCELKWFYNFYKSHSSVFSGGDPPSCASPVHTRNKLFSDVVEDDFRCELPTFKNVDIVFDIEWSKLNCSASGDPTPTLYWVRPDGTTETFYAPENEEAKDNEGIMYITSSHNYDSSDRYKCVASNPAGNVTFSLNVVWPPRAKQTTESLVPTSSGVAPVIRSHDVLGTRDSFGWKANQPEMKMGVIAGQGSENDFTIVDIVGAVVGTFLLTLLVCVVVFHFYYRRRERLRNEQIDFQKDKKRNNLYIMAEADENCVKMINHSNDCHS
ncbi:matrix-remodeling-associated protein 5-like [Gigantopelta aegis]|uniref:matrix-remodeling-associated protein 5-like n=1 Tax=Gigantopelta aegis TaxID=1735272 RepID=UPI001B889AAC|nr:matrix-remodeling-associated protein 5-like [Gigantopelta aegis]